MSQDAKGTDSTRIRVPSRGPRDIPARYEASIVIVEGHAEGMEYPLTKDYTVLGRDKAADIVIKDPLVSRQHAAVVFRDGEFSVKDLESTNGTLVGGKAVDQARIRHRDKFRIGDTVIQFILEDTGTGKVYEIEE